MAYPPAWRQSYFPMSPSISTAGQGTPPSVPATDIFSPEVWLMIMDNLKRSQDLLHLSFTCDFFHNILKYDKQHWEFELILPSIAPYLDLHDVLNCRRVCFDWQNGVDQFAQSSQESLPDSEDYDHLPLNPQTDLLISRLASPAQLLTRQDWTLLRDRFLIAGQWEVCRIIGGSLAIARRWLDLFQNDQERQQGQDFLQLFNSHVSSLEITGSLGGWMMNTHADSNESTYLEVCMLLNEFPNIKTLVVDDPWSRNANTRLTASMTRVCKLAVDMRPLPDMAQLKSLVMTNKAYKPLQEALLEKYASQLEQVGFTLYANIQTRVLQQMGNLTDLLVRLYNLQFYIGDDYNAYLRRLLAIPSQSLKKFTLDFCDLEHASITLATLLDVCQHFPGLKMVCVKGSTRSMMVGADAPGIHVNSVKYLELADVQGVESFNFLECFPNLEFLHIKGVYPTSRYQYVYGRYSAMPHYGLKLTVPEKVEVRKYLYPEEEREDEVDKMYDSNLWWVCPNLQRFVFEYKWSGDHFWLDPGWRGKRGPRQALRAGIPRVYTRARLREMCLSILEGSS